MRNWKTLSLLLGLLVFSAFALVGCAEDSQNAGENQGATGGSQGAANGDQGATDGNATDDVGNANEGHEGQSGENKGAQLVEGYNNEPVTLNFYSRSAGVLDQDDLDELITKPVQEKYPNISTSLLTGNLEELIAGGQIPDIVLTSNPQMFSIMDLGLATDLNDFIKREGIDLEIFEPETINALEDFSEKGEMFGLPFSMNYGMMLYNKDIFDKFAAPHPTDLMTWDEVIDLARRVTRTDGSVQYVGVDLQTPRVLIRPYGLSVVDENQEKSLLQTDGFRKVLSIYEQNYGIEGSVIPDEKYSFGIDHFLKNQQTAMIPYWLAAATARLPQVIESDAGLDWDLVSFPSFADQPEIGREIDFHLMTVSPTVENEEAAYAVVKTIVSEEVQKKMNRGTRMTVLNDPSLKEEVASDTGIYEGKNLQGIFKVKPAPLPRTSEYDGAIYNLLNDAAKAMAWSKVDVNTALREADEKANQHIQANPIQ